MNLIERVKNIIIKPKEEWNVIVTETTAPGQLIMSYLLILALIPAVCTLIGFGIMGYNVPFIGHVPGNITFGIIKAVISFIGTIAGVYISALVIDMLAPSFGTTKNFGKTLQLVVYSYTPMLVAGIFYILPSLGIIGLIAGIYGLYILYIGIKPMLQTPDDKITVYFVVSLIVIIAVSFVIGLILGAILLTGAITGIGAGMHM
jgi:hypothetical protein